jgi:hypothetical protein
MAKQSKKKDRRYKIPTDYLDALSDRLLTTSPSKAIIFNSLQGLFSVGFSKGYARRIADHKYFKDKKEARFNQDWKNMRDYLDNIIHGFPQPKDNPKEK